MDKKTVAIVALTILTICLSSNAVLAQDESILQWAGKYSFEPGEVFSLEIGALGFPYIKCEINGSSIVMLFDTGNISGVFLGREAAERFGLPKTGEVVRRDSSGNRVGSFAVYTAREMTVLGKKWSDVEILQRDEERFEGAVGPRFVMEGRFTIDYKNRLIGVSSSPLPEKEVDNNDLAHLPNDRFPGMIVTRGSVNGHPILIQFDTGKSRSVIDPQLAGELNLPQDEQGAFIKEIKLGSLTFSVKSAKVLSLQGLSKGYTEPILLGIGSDILSQLVLSVDYQRNIVRISR